MLTIGLTGSIGMGKSTTARVFRRAGVPVHDSDDAVHRLYSGEAVAPLGAIFPEAIVAGRVDRTALASAVLGDREKLLRLESIVHPLVAKDRMSFIAAARLDGSPIVVLDIPLLFEIGGEGDVDVIVVPSAPYDVQKARVLQRAGMTEEKLAAILHRQVADSEKRRRAHCVIDTSLGFEAAERAVDALVRALRR
jgi:dephospho-CoA kinase